MFSDDHLCTKYHTYSISTLYTLCYFVGIKESEVGTSYIFFSDIETSLKNGK